MSYGPKLSAISALAVSILFGFTSCAKSLENTGIASNHHHGFRGQSLVCYCKIHVAPILALFSLRLTLELRSTTCEYVFRINKAVAELARPIPSSSMFQLISSFGGYCTLLDLGFYTL
ncbi:hypothetical protein H112_07573 [Trichophyton rubrum D6]|uniref:Uncharacterized protein n=3 Tax=Trichophyton TaxID=5550 RepID=A0A087PFH9_TRIRC|nr:uncharacterized protein TERG_11523 [Trichophyton rubrum CBS 118892]EZF11283.1 hypothetical protein H100_07600 [Trichophyton rubrum MR850]EZF38210.1 hypothetical protein H102_07564 [Trichophyton rubrum CBS 100081]EZF48762.1 hypothetical protein H103_07586 [Trichophyton rubrum CBS 288.86]EZF59457.1 hypothetical protein H104_07535 [Trichophyton rubrum CBS 289.86]EZF70065.1 hypothetical protein H105_07591 [Trichophyton soudanense CBS 452.61]EZF80754.1 hypothetical protein H110_07578 [Trichophy